MAHVISFRTARFDVSKETPNPVNPIAGESVLNWLREQLATAGYQSTVPGTEDWGWYIDVQGAGGSYLVGASADPESPPGPLDWTIQVHKARSMKEKLFGANNMISDDPLSAAIERILRSDSGVTHLSVEKEP